MGYHIKKISLPTDDFKNYVIYESNENNIDNLSKINIFIGSNNSGKSRFLRTLFNQQQYMFSPPSLIFQSFNEIVKSLKSELIILFNTYKINRFGSLKRTDINLLEDIKFINDTDNSSNIVYEILKNARNVNNSSGIDYLEEVNTSEEINNTLGHYNVIIKELISISRNYTKIIDYFFNTYTITFKRVYVPTLRGLRGLDESNQNYYLERTQKDYFFENSDLEIFTGLELYEEVKNLLLGDLKEREIITDFQKFIGNSFFEGEAVALIPKRNSDVLYVKIGTEKEYPIYNLGDGVQSLIILTFPLFKYRGENLLLFIEEPELYLHPGMQRKFLEIITHEDFNGYQYFLTTHSNHFLDMTLDVEKMSLYSFSKELANDDSKEKKAKFLIENISNENDNILKILGVKNSAIFLSNCTIWVEGITDRYYIRHFLNLYQDYLKTPKIYKEDIHYSFVEYSGNNITHWSFLENTDSDDETDGNEVFKSINESRVCATLFLISDKDGGNKHARQSKLTEVLGERYFCLECREIENIISVNTLKKVIASYEKVQVDKLIFNEEISYETYKSELLGNYINNVLENKSRKSGYASSSGAVKDKIGFSKIAISNMNTFEDLSEEAKRLCKELYKFITINN